MAKLFAVLISSLRLFQSRLPLNFHEFVPNFYDLAGGSLQSILILKSYSATFLVMRSHIYGGFKWFSVLYTSTISFCRLFCELSKFHPYARVHQASLRYHYYKLFSLHAWLFYLLNCLRLYYKATISESNIVNCKHPILRHASAQSPESQSNLHIKVEHQRNQTRNKKRRNVPEIKLSIFGIFEVELVLYN